MARKKVERNIYYDADKKRYYVKLYHGKNDQGKYIYKYKTEKTKKEAQATLAAFEHGRNTGTVTQPSEHTVETWLEYWMKNEVEVNSQATTIYGYRNIIKNHLIPELGNIKLQKLTANQLQQYYTLKMETLSSNTVQKHHNLLQTALRMAERHDIITRLPTSRVTRPKATQADIEVINSEQLQQLIEKAYNNEKDKHALLLLIIIIAYTGIRRGEAMGLTWGDINFEKSQIFIRKARTTAGSAEVIKRPKTSSSIRVIPMPDRVKLQLLRTLAENRISKVKGTKQSDFIIVNDKGIPCRPNYMSMLFRRLADECGFNKLTIHGLRHTFASIANEKGHTMFDISKSLGHSRPDITAKTYMHLFAKADERLIESISTSIEDGLTTKIGDDGRIDEVIEKMAQEIAEQEQEIETKKAMIEEYRKKIEQVKAETKISRKKNLEKEREVQKLREDHGSML